MLGLFSCKTDVMLAMLNGIRRQRFFEQRANRRATLNLVNQQAAEN